MAEEILLSLFLSAGLCLGLPMVVWALFSLRRHQEAGVHVSAFVISLIFSDIVEILLSPFVNTRFLEENPCHNHLPCWRLYSTFAEARLCGLHFNQLVALEGILSLLYPRHSVRFHWSIILSIIIWISVISCNFFTFGYTTNLTMCVVPVILAIIMSVFAIKAKHNSSTGALQCTDLSTLAVAVALFTLVVLYMPWLVLCCVTYPLPFYKSPWATKVVSITSLRLVTEPLLCVLVCREILMSQIQRRHTETAQA